MADELPQPMGALNHKIWNVSVGVCPRLVKPRTPIRQTREQNGFPRWRPGHVVCADSSHIRGLIQKPQPPREFR